MKSNVIRIATRGSALALAQTKLIADALTKIHPEIEVDIVTVSTKGDRDRISPLWQMSGSGFFTTQVEQELLDDRADIAVHSYKDLPAQVSNELVIAAVPERKFAEDVLAASQPVRHLNELKQGAHVGSSSPRRIVQLKHFRPDLKVDPIRGNVETRLSKVTKKEFDAVVLARAGLERLNLSPEISFAFDPTQFIPAPAQGAIAVQCRRGDAKVKTLLSDIHHRPTGIAVDAERRVLAALHPGCHAPLGVYARISDQSITIYAFAADLDAKQYIKETVEGPILSSDELADKLVKKLLSAGAGEILEAF